MYIFLLFIIISVAYTTPVVLVLGSHMPHLLKDRLDTAIEHVANTEVIWYLSGGIKHYLDQDSEAVIMSKHINDVSDHLKIIDTKARNTAENFAYFRMWLENNEVDEVIVVTSEFHFERAKKIFDGIIPNLQVTWIGGKASCSYCKSDEYIHMKNVEDDIRKGLDTYIKKN